MTRTAAGPTKDRSYYRTLNAKQLVEEARYGVNVNWQELSTVMAECIDDQRRAIEDARYDAMCDAREWE